MATITVEGRYTGNNLVRKIRADSRGRISKRQYDYAAKKLHLIAGDYLRLAPVSRDCSPIEVIDQHGVCGFIE